MCDDQHVAFCAIDIYNPSEILCTARVLCHTHLAICPGMKSRAGMACSALAGMRAGDSKTPHVPKSSSGGSVERVGLSRAPPWFKLANALGYAGERCDWDAGGSPKAASKGDGVRPSRAGAAGPNCGVPGSADITSSTVWSIKIELPAAEVSEVGASLGDFSGRPEGGGIAPWSASMRARFAAPSISQQCAMDGLSEKGCRSFWVRRTTK